jgi:(1->4)-alpha-D-glucan 1-alpha-D-glucosylmutase
MLHTLDTEGALAVCNELTDTLHNGRIKLWTTHRALYLRNEMPELFRSGDYLSLTASEPHAQNVIAFLRRYEETSVLAVAPRFACTLMRHRPELPLGEAWGKAQLLAPQCAGQRFENVFTGERMTVPEDGRVPLSRVFENFPVALFWRVG